VVATLLIAAHGTRSAAGSATVASLAKAIATARPHVPVSLCFLDVAEPSLATALDSLSGRPVVVVPLLLSAGYHVTTDIPAVVAGRQQVRVARHLGPDPAVIEALADRLAEAGGAGGMDGTGGTDGPVLLAAIASSRSTARAEVEQAAAALAERLARPVRVLGLGDDRLTDAQPPYRVSTYLLAEGGFLDQLRADAAGDAVVAAPIGVHPAVVSLTWTRYDEASAVDATAR
jgi:sirohydrochlorin ferrochelatase